MTEAVKFNTSRETSNIGKAVIEGQKKQTEHVDVIELQREMLKRLPQMFEDIIANHKDYAEEYFVVLENQKFRHMPNAIRQYLIVRKTRPKPNYDMSLWHYSNKTEKLEYCWTVPDRETVEFMYENILTIPQEQKLLLKFVIDFKEDRLI